MDKKALRKHVTKLEKKLIAEYNFIKKGGYLVRRRENVLQIICLQILSYGLRCTVALQPLYIQWAFIHITFGRDLEFFQTEKFDDPMQDCETEEEIKAGLEKVLAQIEEKVLPWFDEVEGAQGLADFLENEKAYINRYIFCNPFFKYLFQGFSHLCLKNYDRASEALQNACKEGNVDEEYLLHMMDLLNQKKYDQIDRELAICVIEMAEKFGVGEEGI